MDKGNNNNCIYLSDIKNGDDDDDDDDDDELKQLLRFSRLHPKEAVFYPATVLR